MATTQVYARAARPYPIVPESERTDDWRYQIMELNKDELLTRVQDMPRLQLVEWLAWNDVHGIFLDEDCLAEDYPILTKQDAERCVYIVIMRNREDWDGYMGDTDVRDMDFDLVDHRLD